jgi:glyoxylase-like metal-dependent hydrolase (beta-lactamase superfamily II)
LRIKVLGTRGEVEPSVPYHSKHSGVLVDNRLLLDLGEREYLNYRPEAVFITHLHPDHAFFITEPASIDVPVYAPEESDKAGLRVIESTVQVGPYRVTPIPTHHSKKVRSSAYLVESGQQKLLYTGDVIWINKEYHQLLDGLALVITEASFVRKGGMVRKDRDTGRIYGHTGVPNLIALFRPFTRHILLVHFGNWFYRDTKAARDKLQQMGKSEGVTVHVGYDGLELDLDDLGAK